MEKKIVYESHFRTAFFSIDSIQSNYYYFFRLQEQWNDVDRTFSISIRNGFKYVQLHNFEYLNILWFLLQVAWYFRALFFTREVIKVKWGTKFEVLNVNFNVNGNEILSGACFQSEIHRFINGIFKSDVFFLIFNFNFHSQKLFNDKKNLNF